MAILVVFFSRPAGPAHCQTVTVTPGSTVSTSTSTGTSTVLVLVPVLSTGTSQYTG
jgi:hypothetical protein